MTVEEALEFFRDLPKLEAKLRTLSEVASAISASASLYDALRRRSQRVKLATELSKRSTGRTIYILDEPTTGLHMHEVGKLVTVLHHLVELGATVVVIEHDLDVIRNADFLIDMGPGGGEAGGRIVASGTPEEIQLNPDSITGQYL